VTAAKKGQAAAKKVAASAKQEADAIFRGNPSVGHLTREGRERAEVVRQAALGNELKEKERLVRQLAAVRKKIKEAEAEAAKAKERGDREQRLKKAALTRGLEA
jgi:hypothetical protein